MEGVACGETKKAGGSGDTIRCEHSQALLLQRITLQASPEEETRSRCTAQESGPSGRSPLASEIKEIQTNQRNQTIKRMPRGGKRPGAGRKPIAVKSIAAKTAKAIARKPTPQRTRKSKKKTRRKSVIAKLTPRQGKLLDGIAQLKTPVQAARDAGYSESTAASSSTGTRAAPTSKSPPSTPATTSTSKR